MAYLDTSVLTAYYCPERLSSVVQREIGGDADPVISSLVELELHSALALKVRMKELEAADASRMLSTFRVHVADGVFRMVSLGAREHDLARGWLARFVVPLRTLDALHLAATFANGLTLVTADRPLARAAGQLGMAHRLLA
jgi:uncharacterized protein